MCVTESFSESIAIGFAVGTRKSCTTNMQVMRIALSVLRSFFFLDRAGKTGNSLRNQCVRDAFRWQPVFIYSYLFTVPLPSTLIPTHALNNIRLDSLELRNPCFRFHVIDGNKSSARDVQLNKCLSRTTLTIVIIIK